MDMDFEVNMNEYLPLRDVVFNTLRKAILRGELKPGERLMEIQLANKLGVSRTPIREAIRKLELEGLVLMIPRKGAEVAQITEKNMQDVLEVRKALEELSVQLACERITPEQVEEMKMAAEDFRKVLKSGDVTKIAEADVKFHDIIFAATNNQRLITLLNNLREQMYRFRVEYLKQKECYPQLLEEHDKLIALISGGEVEEACELMGCHIDNQASTVSDVIRRDQVEYTQIKCIVFHMLSILLVSKTGGTYENEKNKSIGAGTDHDSVWCGICKGNAGGSEGECSAGKVIR